MNKISNKMVAIIIPIIMIGMIAAIYIYNTKHYIIKDKFSFSEVTDIDCSFSKEESSNINVFLAEKVYEDDQYFGFNYNKENIDLYTTHAFVKIAVVLNSNELIEQLKDKLQFLKNTNTDSMSILNLIYYVNICEMLGLNYNLDMIYDSLKKFYDTNSKLFYLNSVNDSLNIKITVTALCCNMIKENSLYEKFDIKNGVFDTYKTYTFETSESSSLYNSGGDILYCLDAIGEIENINLKEKESWFECWKKKYESIDIDGIESILQYSEFYNIAVLFDENYSNEKIEKFYESMNSAYLSENMDFFMLINSIENIDNYDNVTFNTELINAVKDEIQQGNLFEAKIDLQSTVYGIILADNSGFNYNKDKVQNYINQNYHFIDESRDHLEVTNYLYYTVMLEQIVNDYKVEYNSNYLQEKMDFVLNEIEYGLKNAEESIEETRKILELVMDLEIHNVDVHITEKQRRKIKKAIKAYWKNENIAHSYLIIDMYLIDKILVLTRQNL